ncbi:MAG: Ig-like domain-containing protein [Candidatus Diapherotrites archaeon]
MLSSGDGTKTVYVWIQDAAGNVSSPGSDTIILDTTKPTLSEVTPVTSPTNDNTPDYTFYSSEAGTINYSGGCESSTTTAVAGNNTITFNELADGTYNCTITVTDAAGNTSDPLNISPFTVSTKPKPQPGGGGGGGTYYTQVCGDKICDAYKENYCNCPSDCSKPFCPVCTELVCENGSPNCKAIIPCVGNGICEEGETYENAPSDCLQPFVPVERPSFCGDGVCNPWENCSTCAADCACEFGRSCVDGTCVKGPYCGDFICQTDESYETCPQDCPAPETTQPPTPTETSLATPTATVAPTGFFGLGVIGDLGFLFLLLLLLLIILSQIIFLEVETTGYLASVRAKNFLGKPMDNSEIRVFKEGKLLSTKFAGEDGKVTFQLGEGEYKVKASKGRIKRSLIPKTVKLGK